MKKIFVIMLAIFLFLGCEKIGNEYKKNIDYKARRKEILTMIDTRGLSSSNFPFIDCSTSTSPLRDLVMYNTLDIPYKWFVDVVTGSEYHIAWELPKGISMSSDEHVSLARELNELSRSNGSHGAYVNLIDGKTDLIIDSRDISRKKLEYSTEKDVKIVTKPLAWDAMVFLVHPDNQVKSLALEQIQDIYTGEITI